MPSPQFLAFRADARRGRMLVCCFALALVVSLVRANEEGLPLLRTYNPNDYQNIYQMFSGVLSPDGVVNFGGYAAVVRFDGHTWTSVKTDGAAVRAQTIGPDGRVYVAGDDFFGRLEPDDFGVLHYRSLLTEVDGQPAKAPGARSLAASEEGVFVGTERGVLHYQPDGKLKLYPLSAAGRNRVSRVGDKIVNYSLTEGLHVFAAGKWTPASTAAPLKTDALHFLTDPVEPGDIALLGMSKVGLFRITAQGEAVRLVTTADEALKDRQLFTACVRRDGSLMIGTADAGAFWVSRDRQRFRHFPPVTVLPSPTISSLFEDKEGGVWMSTYNGLARLDPDTPATVFDQRNGLGTGIISAMVRHEGQFYIVFNGAVMRLTTSDKPGAPARFVRDERIPANAPLNGLISHPSGLIFTTLLGISRLHADKVETIALFRDGASVPYQSPLDPNRVYFAISTKTRSDVTVGSIYFRDGTWKQEGMLADAQIVPRDLYETSDGSLWWCTETRGVIRVRRPKPDDWTGATVTYYAEAQGIPNVKNGGRFQYWHDGFINRTEDHGFRYNPATDRFELDQRWELPVAGKPWIRALHPNKRGGWGMISDGSFQAPMRFVEYNETSGGKIAAREIFPSLNYLLGSIGVQMACYEPAADGRPAVIWAKGMDNVVRYELDKPAVRTGYGGPILRSISVAGAPAPLAPATPPTFPYSNAPIEFNVASPIFGFGRNLQFQFRLLGFQEDWSEFRSDRRITFTNLEGGPFTLEVRAKDAAGEVSETTRYTFHIAPPWYRRPATYAGGILLLAGAIAGFIRLRLRHARREQLRLENLVAQRTVELKVAKDAADEANRAKSTFLANMSHELRTPLNGVIGYAQVLMKDRELSEKNRERLRIVQTSGEHLLRMINEVLDFSKIEAGKMELVTTPFHLPQLLRDIAAAVSPRFEQKGLEFVFDPAPDLPDLVLGDPQKLRQVIDNLLGNAAKFTSAGTVRFRAQLSGLETVEFSVTDTGVGIAAQDLGRLFQPFQQAVDGRPPEPGTGLGLAISQRLVTLMGSRLGVESQPGEGSRFFFAVELPVLAVDATAQRTETQAIVGYRGARRRLLIVDDVATNRHVLRDLLTPLGFAISEAAGGAEALAVVPQVQPELIFLDLRMPGIDGFELARRLRERPGGRELKIFAMSASVLSFNREKAFAAGCDDFLPKPFREEDLLSRLGLALQLEWVRDAEAPVARPASRSPFPSLTTQLSTAVVEELLAIARRGEIAVLRRRLDELKGDPLVDSLDVFVKTYRMERIREVLERHLSSPPPAS